MSSQSMSSFIKSHTKIVTPPLTPELRLYLATAITPLWQATEDLLARMNLPPPFWAFSWAGGQALARFLLDRRQVAAGRRVLDFAAGSGLAGIAAARMGARRVIANDIDPFAETAQQLNAQLNRVTIETLHRDLVGRSLSGIDLVLAGDICYERRTAERIFSWLQGLAGAGKMVLMGDPGRTYLPQRGLRPVTSYRVPTPREIEDRDIRETTIWRVLPP